MSITLDSWKEIYTLPENNIIYRILRNLFFQNTQYEILFRHKKTTDDRSLQYITAYVKLPSPLKKKYIMETYRERNIIGIDTYNDSDSLIPNQIKLARYKISNIIKEHHDKT